MTLEDWLVDAQYGVPADDDDADADAVDGGASGGLVAGTQAISSSSTSSRPQVLTDQARSPRILEDQIYTLQSLLESGIKEHPLFYQELDAREGLAGRGALIKHAARSEMARNGARKKSLTYGEVVFPDFKAIVQEVVAANYMYKEKEEEDQHQEANDPPKPAGQNAGGGAGGTDACNDDDDGRRGRRRQSLRFLDLGSGQGLAVWAALGSGVFSHATGFELVPRRVKFSCEASKAIAVRYKKYSSNAKHTEAMSTTACAAGDSTSQSSNRSAVCAPNGTSSGSPTCRSGSSSSSMHVRFLEGDLRDAKNTGLDEILKDADVIWMNNIVWDGWLRRRVEGLLKQHVRQRRRRRRNKGSSRKGKRKKKQPKRTGRREDDARPDLVVLSNRKLRTLPADDYVLQSACRCRFSWNYSHSVYAYSSRKDRDDDRQSNG